MNESHLSAALEGSQESRPTPPADYEPCRAVVKHLVRCIQDDPDVRYFVGGPFTRMRGLLEEAYRAEGGVGDIDDVLSPPPHRVDDEARHERLERKLDGLREAVEGFLRALDDGRQAELPALRADIQRWL